MPVEFLFKLFPISNYFFREEKKNVQFLRKLGNTCTCTMPWMNWNRNQIKLIQLRLHVKTTWFSTAEKCRQGPVGTENGNWNRKCWHHCSSFLCRFVWFFSQNNKVVVVRMLSDTGKSFYHWWSSRFKTKILSIFRIKTKLKHFRKETT